MSEWKFQITNLKRQTNNNDRNSKSQTKKKSLWTGLEFEIWGLRLIWNLMLEICDLIDLCGLGFIILKIGERLKFT
ncbi:MAG: hypothetical protein R6U40_01990 [Desulfobacterales bacterium]